MSDWEVHDLAIQVVAAQIEQSGGTIFSRQPSPHIDPQFWFRDDAGAAFVVVRSGRFPLQAMAMPANVADIKASCARLSHRGFFASVIVANGEQQTAPASLGTLPLYRGHAMFIPDHISLKSIE